MRIKRRNALAKAVRTPVFRQRIVADKRRKEQCKQAERDIRERFSKRINVS